VLQTVNRCMDVVTWSKMYAVVWHTFYLLAATQMIWSVYRQRYMTMCADCCCSVHCNV
jgi:hypothetical protein